ncbi:MAG: TonB-dependent receptor [Armatimonadota bacterium]|nr:TonB-dependent receptor [Armatimonadota bacterium]
MVRYALWGLTSVRLRAQIVWLAAALLAICGFGQQQANPVQFETQRPLRYDSALDTVEGESVQLRWREYTLEGTRLWGSLREGQYRLFEGVRLTGNGVFAQGKELRFFTRERRWSLLDGTAELQPVFMQNRLLQSLHLQGEQVEGVQDRVQAERCTATTCALEHPHFQWSARSLDAIAGDRAVLRDVRLQILGRTVLRLPYVAVPLREGEESPLPDVGYTEEEGFYARYTIAYLLAQGALGSVRFDAMQKRGLGINLVQDYARGSLNLYALRDTRQRADSLTGRWQHAQNFGALQTRWNAEFRRNSYLLFRDNTAWNWRTDWTLPTRVGTTRLGFAESRNRTGTFESLNRNFTIQDTRTFGRLQTDLSGEYLEQESRFAGTRRGNRQWNLRGNLRYALEREVSLQLDFDRFLPVGESRVFGGLERLPELSLVASARGLGLPLPQSQLRLSVGRYTEGFQARLTRERYAFEWQGQLGTRASPNELRPRTSWSYRFRQSFYSDDTAQYLLQSVLEQTVPLAQRSRLNLRWNYLRPYGYSPLGIDRVGVYNLLSGELQLLFGGGWSVGVQTSYDLLAADKRRDPWSLLNINAEYQPAEWLRWRALLGYDLNRERWRTVQTDLRWQFGDSRLLLAARYDPERAKWGSVFLRVDALKWGRSRISFLTQYNGYLNRFESRQALWTYDLHCAELEVRYIDNPFGFRRDRGLQIFIRLKALPSVSRFGLGQFGQPVGTLGSEF